MKKTIAAIVVVVIIVALNFFAAKDLLKRGQPNDLNSDGTVDLQDFSMSLSRTNSIAEEIQNQTEPENVIRVFINTINAVMIRFVKGKIIPFLIIADQIKISIILKDPLIN